MLNAICITTNQLEHIQTNLCIHLSYLEDQRNLKIYNKNIKKNKKQVYDHTNVHECTSRPHFIHLYYVKYGQSGLNVSHASVELVYIYVQAFRLRTTSGT